MPYFVRDFHENTLSMARAVLSVGEWIIKPSLAVKMEAYSLRLCTTLHAGQEHKNECN